MFYGRFPSYGPVPNGCGAFLRPFLYIVFLSRGNHRKAELSSIMKPIHTIRLKGPWDYTWLEPVRTDEEKSLLTPGRVQAPVSWKDCFGARAGCVRWSRRFQSPTNLDPHERVLLSLEGIRGVERVCLNDSMLPMLLLENDEQKYDLTDRLRPTNLIEIETRHAGEDDPAQSGLWSPVVLEIWSTEN